MDASCIGMRGGVVRDDHHFYTRKGLYHFSQKNLPM